MQKRDAKLAAADGTTFDCSFLLPKADAKVPAIVLASAIHGVDEDQKGIAEEVAAKGYIVAAPDLFSRSVPGPLQRDDPRSQPRGQPRPEKIKDGEKDLAALLAMLQKEPQFNGKAAVMGFCYGGPFAILGPKRLGYAAGISCHGTQMLDYLPHLEDLDKPVCVIWGDQDVMAPPPVLEAYRAMAARNRNLDLHIFPGIQHGYMMKTAPKVYDRKLYEFSMDRAFAILEGLR